MSRFIARAFDTLGFWFVMIFTAGMLVLPMMLIDKLSECR